MGVTIWSSENDEREWPDDSETRTPLLKTHFLIQMAHLTLKTKVAVDFLIDKGVLVDNDGP